MSVLTDGIDAAEQRKQALFGDEYLSAQLMIDPDGGRAIFNGFDIDMTEFEELSLRAGGLFLSCAGTMGLLRLFQGAWAEGLLVGLMIGKASD